MQNNPGLKSPMPVSKGFKYGESGPRENGGEATKIQRGGDLRSKPGKNNGK